MPLLEYLRPLLVMAMLGYASYKDLRTREINDVVWVIFGASGLVIDVYDVATGSMGLLDLILPVAFMVVFALVSGYLGFFGGADLLAFVVLGLLQPVAPRLVGSYPGFAPLFFPLTLVSNSVLVGASSSVIVLLKNIASRGGGPLFSGHEREPFWRKLALIISARRVGVEGVRGPPYQYPVEYKDPNTGELRLRLRPELEDDDAAIKVFEGLKGSGRTRIWVSYTIPFLFVLTFGYIVSISFGDVALFLISKLFGG